MDTITTQNRLAPQPTKTIDQVHGEKYVLIAEDDLALRPLWEYAFKTSGVEGVVIDWTARMEEAEQLIRHRYSSQSPYQLVIADIYLEGNGTGIDLWNRYGEEAKDFVFVSASPISKLELMKALNFGNPLFLQKPMTLSKCRKVAERLLGS